MSKRRALSEEERALWSGFVRSISPLDGVRDSAEAEAGGETSPPPPRLTVSGVAPKGRNSPPLAPLGRRLKQRIGRGHEAIDARLDLHGRTQTQAHTALLRFLRRAQADGAKIALVVTGKGSGEASDQGRRDAIAERGVLRRQVPLWLSLPEFRSLVVGFEEAHPSHGGSGALYVRLRRAILA